MKKLIKIMYAVMVIIMLVGIIPGYNADKYAIAATKAIVEFNSINVTPGSEIEVTATFHYTKGVGGYQLKVPYNKTQFEFVSGESILKTSQFDANDMEDGINIVAILSDDITKDKENVFKLKFKVKSTATTGSYAITTSSGDLINGSSYQSVSYDVKSGSINIATVVKGDIDGNGKINITDAMRVFQYVSGRNKTFTDKNITAADINNDGKVNITDAIKIFHYVSGRIKTLGTGTVTPTTVNVTGVTLSKTSLSLTTGGTSTLTATVSPSNATNKSVTWSSSNTGVATVDGSGKVTAKGAGSAVITVKTASNGKTASCTVTVTNPVINVTGVTLSKTSLSLTTGGTSTLTATVSPSNATNKSVTWSSSNTSVATVDGSGKVTAKGAGSAVITVKTANSGKTASCTVTVTNPTVAVTGVSITNKPSYLALDYASSNKNTFQAQISVSPSNATNKSVTWTSSNTNVVTVDANGKVKAIGRGTATVSCTTKNGGYKDSFNVWVYKASNVVNPQSSGKYFVIKAFDNNNLVIDVCEGKTANGTKVELWNRNNGNNQLWQFHDYTSQHGGLAFVPLCNSGAFVLDVHRNGNAYNSPLTSGCKVDLWTLGQDDAASMFSFVKLWDNSYMIKLINTNLCVSVDSLTSGSQLIVKEFNPFDTKQRWWLEETAPSTGNNSSDSVTQKINSLRSRYVHGQYWNVYNGLDKTGTIACPCGNSTCPTDCACACGEFKINGQLIAKQCHGYALKMAYEVFGENANTWSKHTNTNSIYAGDVIRLYNNGHSIFVTKVDGNNIYYTDCNWTGRCKVRWDGCMTRSQIASNLTYIAHKSGNNSLGK